MLRANQAVRLGLRAAARNPELAFAKALLDLGGNALAAMPFLVFAGFVLAALGDPFWLHGLARAAAVASALRWPLTGALLAALALAWTASLAFWAGALPLLAADAEMGARPPPGLFLGLASRGFARTAAASTLAALLSGGFFLGTLAALAAAAVAAAARPSPAVLAGAAALGALALLGGAAIDLLARLMVVRAAALGDGAVASFARAASLLGKRLGACLAIAAAFALLEVVAAGAFAAFGSAVAEGLDARRALLALAPRGALAIASAVIFAWLETARQGALAALAADDAGLLPAPVEPPQGRRPRIPEPWELRPPPRPAEPVEAIPVAELLPEPEPAKDRPGEGGEGKGGGEGDGGDA